MVSRSASRAIAASLHGSRVSLLRLRSIDPGESESGARFLGRLGLALSVVALWVGLFLAVEFFLLSALPRGE